MRSRGTPDFIPLTAEVPTRVQVTLVTVARQVPTPMSSAPSKENTQA